MGRTVLVLTGEPSGDLAASGFVSAIRAQEPGIRVVAVGGPRLAAAGAEILQDIASISAMGFVEVVRQIPRLAALERRLVRFLRDERPDVLVPVDFPGFNLRIAARAKELGIPVAYYIAPQVWAWGRERTKKIAGLVDRLMVVLPFEEKLFRAEGVDATFVGHPLLEGLAGAPSRGEARNALGFGPERPVLGLLPGSRPQEIRRILPAMLGGARLARDRRPDLAILVSRQESLPREALAAVDEAAGERIVEGPAAGVIRASDVLLVTSGTATLESALLGTSLAVVYKTSPVTFAIGRALVNLPRIGLANIVAGEEVAPEFIQNAAHPEALARFALDLLARPEERAARSERLRALGAKFEGRAASAHAARIVIDLMNERETGKTR